MPLPPQLSISSAARRSACSGMAEGPAEKLYTRSTRITPMPYILYIIRGFAGKFKQNTGKMQHFLLYFSSAIGYNS